MNEKRFETMEEFAEAVRTEFEKRIEKSVIVQKLNKNNGIVLYSLTVLEDEINISATIYLEPYYEVYEDTGMEYILDRLERVYEENKPEQSFDISKILDYESIKENLRAKLINYELNRDFLKEVPHRRFLDLAIVAYISLEMEEEIEGNATITVKNNLQQTWKVDTEKLIDTALENIKGDVVVANMSEYVDISLFGDIENLFDIYVLTNRLKLHGAVAMLQKDRLKQFAEEQEKETLTILPSSIHECIIINVEDEPKNTKELREMVKEVNETVVSDQDILSNNVYIYNRTTDKITIA